MLSNARPKNNVNKVPRWVLRYMGIKTFDFSSKKKNFFAPKRPNLAQNWHFWSIWARPNRLIRCPVDESVGGCGAQAVSRKTPIYFMIYCSDQQFRGYDTRNKKRICLFSSA